MKRKAQKTMRFLGRGVRTLLFAKGRARVRLVLLLVFLAAFLAVNLDYSRYWNEAADWTNTQLEAADVPASLEQYDRWGVFETIDTIARVPAFPDSAYSLGLDLQGGIHLVYQADLSAVNPTEEDEKMEALRDRIERRVNTLGVREPLVQLQGDGDNQRLIVELAGISDPQEAIRQIGETPYLEFKEPRDREEQINFVTQVFEDISEEEITPQDAANFCAAPNPQILALALQTRGVDPCFAKTKLDGTFLDGATVQFDPQTNEPQIGLQFNEEGSKLFADITERNIGKTVAIYIDEFPVSIPRVSQRIEGGQAVITGSFTLDEARDLARALSDGALPVPIALISQQQIGPQLGEESLNSSLFAAFLGLATIAAFLIVVYRFSGFIAVISLLIYLAFLLALIKFIPVTLTLSGIAGLILSIGMAVDANVLVFERLREEIKGGHDNLSRAIDNAFARAWPSIRDGNLSTLLTAVILFWFSTSFVQGFALVLGIGIVVSLFTAMVVTRYLLKLVIAWPVLRNSKVIWTR